MSSSVGEQLKSAREARRLSLQEACGITKIQKQTLEAIEQDRVQESLDPVYARIFVKKYAAFLGLDAAAVADEYPGLARGTAVGVAVPTLEQRAEAAPRLNWLVPAAVTGVALVGIAFLGYMAVDLFHTLRQQHPLQSLAQPKSEPEPKLLVPASKPLKLTVQTTAEVWLQVKADGDIVFQGILGKGVIGTGSPRESWTAKKELELWTGNAGAMELSLNGKPLEWTERGVRKGVKITHAGIQD